MSESSFWFIRLGDINIVGNKAIQLLKMAEKLTPIKLDEMRPGLFRIHWTFFEIKKNLGIYTEEFQLCGSQLGRKFKITYHLKSLGENNSNNRDYTVTIDEIPFNDDSSVSVSNAVNFETRRDHHEQPKRQKLADSNVMRCKILRPVYIWMHVGPNSDGTNPIHLIENNAVQWQVDCVGKLQLWFTIWMDFGFNTVTEKKIATGLSTLFENQTLCDVKFHLNDGQSVGAHAAILSAGSPLFAAMFQSGSVMSEAREVVIENVDPQVFIQLLTCLYTGSAPKLNEVNITRPLLELADMYDVETLKDECIDVLKKELKIDNAIEMFIWSHVNSISKLFEEIMKFVVKNSRQISSQAEWMELAKNHPELCVQTIQRMADLLHNSEN